jgi:amyloid beta precursor protein binding protein 1
MATDNKYDRQLRLWGPHGQKEVNESKICVLGSSALATESLKNLVLPGVGHFTIVDNAVVSARDLGNSFFVTEADIDQPRAAVTLRLLLELNPDVTGDYLAEDPGSVIETNPAYFDSFNLIISTQVPYKYNILLSEICNRTHKKLIIAKSYGLFLYLRQFTTEHPVVESKPADVQMFDLKLHKPFNELVEYVDRIDMNSLDEMAHGHMPYVVILLKAMAKWKTEHNGNLPSNFNEKNQFKTYIKELAKHAGEVNFIEAANLAYLCWAEEIPEEIDQILRNPKCLQASSGSKLFWICAKALSEFVSVHNELPLSGSFPDMTSDTTTYITLQTLYCNKAKQDLDFLLSQVQNIKQAPLSSEDIEYISRFSKNIRTLSVTHLRSLQEEQDSPNIDEINSSLLDENNLLDYYICMQACESFFNSANKYPGDTSDWESDIPKLQEYVDSLVKRYSELGCENLKVSKDLVHEFTRYGASELHTLSAILGGVVSQEAIKLLTCQYTPLNNTFLYSGVNCLGQVIEL